LLTVVINILQSKSIKSLPKFDKFKKNIIIVFDVFYLNKNKNMKKVSTKLQNHSKKIIVHLKRHHKKYLFWALCSGILALIWIFTTGSINNIFADETTWINITINNDNTEIRSWAVESWFKITDSWSLLEVLSGVSKTWYKLVGWYETGATEQFDLSTAITWDLDLYAGWIKTYQVNYYDWESLISYTTVISWSTVELQPENPNKTWFIFSWWYETGATESFDFNTVITWDFNLYAKRIKTYQINFIDSWTIIASWTVESWATASWVRPADPQKTGYTFSWRYLSGATGAFNFNTVITWDLNLYAKRIKIYQVNFIDSGTIIASWAVESWATASWVRPANPQKTGYTFSWWYLSGAAETFNFNTAITWDLNLYAKRYITPKVSIKNSNEMMTLYNGTKAISCEHNYTSWTYLEQTIIYVKNGKVYEYSLFSGYDDEDEDYFYIYTKALYKNDHVYWWWTLFGSWKWIWAEVEDFSLQDAFDSLFDGLTENEVYMCSTWVEDTSVFNTPDWIIFYDQEHYHYSYDEDVSFMIIIDDTINAWEYTKFTIKVLKDDGLYEDYTGTVILALVDKNGDYIDSNYYTIANNWLYDFEKSDKWKKTFKEWLKIKKAWTYVLQIEWLNWWMSEETITVKWNGNNDYDDFEYDTLKFNPNYSDEMNEAYQYARYYDITTKDSIKDAKMGSGLNRIAMAKMLANYAENVLWIDDYNTSRNCTFSDVPTSLDRQYDYWVTKVCQLWIMWVNTPNHKFYPNWWVTRAEFATALSRLLYNTKDWTDKYYSTHISKLYREWIINNTDPKLREKRWYVMLMLMRAQWEYDD